MALLIVAQIQFIYDVDDLSKQNTVFHIVVSVLKSGLDDRLSDGRFRRCYYAFYLNVTATV
ncbi:hypothetical protein SDC9_197031 [bioreactor metagenome]|uniref:Uncharacterized protein n=1 Tax=bioreactor metagenome TaxID=1076179 RepID=A0A645IE59_9ZZZZ